MTDGWDPGLEERALATAEAAADEIVADLTEQWRRDGTGVRPSVEFVVGAEDQPVFAFTLNLDLEDDFDAKDWPSLLVERADRQVRERVIGSSVDDWDWLVTARATTRIE